MHAILNVTLQTTVWSFVSHRIQYNSIAYSNWKKYRND